MTTTPTGATEEYNGSTWTSSGSLGTARYGLGGAGTQTAALAFGGSGPLQSNRRIRWFHLDNISSKFKTARVSLGGVQELNLQL
jgi:hypothetical protein